MYRKLHASVLIGISSISFSGQLSAESEVNAPNHDYAIMLQKNHPATYLRSKDYLNWARYGINYSFHGSLDTQPREFGDGSICLRTNPVATMKYNYDDRFSVTLHDRSWFWSTKNTYTLRVNEWTQVVRWDNIRADKYHLSFCEE